MKSLTRLWTRHQQLFFDMLVNDGGKVNAIYFTMCEEDLDRIVSDPHTMIGTDGLVASLDGKTHPRGWASFPRAIRLFVKEKQLFSLETMIHKGLIPPPCAMRYGFVKAKLTEIIGEDAWLPTKAEAEEVSVLENTPKEAPHE